LYRAHRGHYPNIQRLMDESAYFPNAEVGHLDAHTAVGHAAIGTGAYPIKSKEVGNTFYYYENGKLTSNEIYAGKDETVVDPSELNSETLADVLDRENEDKSEVISQCYALRASIGMAGHGAYRLKGTALAGDRDHVYWLDKNTKRWTTDFRYYNAPYFLYQYDSAARFHEEYPSGWRSVKLSSIEEARKNYHLILGSPAEVKMETEMFLKALDEIILKREKNKDGYTDLAYVTFKATDAAGHAFGWESLEALDTFEETDRQVGKIWEFLEKNFKDEYILILTADHGCAPLPEISGGRRMHIANFISELNTLLPQEAIAKNESLVTKMTVAQVSLNHNVIYTYNISMESIRKKILSMKVDGKKFFKDVIL
ncbi:MAG: alkaline phosphatase family protein, partial [Candidatus Methanomethyliaceae archaeon]|nr:alkaline phosphatase family protein [Candidatus Methanomethyliaceae archaeon]